MTIPDPTYITAAQVASNTLITALANLGEENVTKIIKRAEGQIDKYVGRQEHHPDDDNTDRVFPRLEDDDCGSPVIPLDISHACLAQVEFLYTQWWSTSGTTQEPVSRDVKSESIGGDGSYSAAYGDGPVRPGDLLCAQAKMYLDGYVNRFVALSVTDPDTVPSPT